MHAFVRHHNERTLASTIIQSNPSLGESRSESEHRVGLCRYRRRVLRLGHLSLRGRSPSWGDLRILRSPLNSIDRVKAVRFRRSCNIQTTEATSVEAKFRGKSRMPCRFGIPTALHEGRTCKQQRADPAGSLTSNARLDRRVIYPYLADASNGDCYENDRKPRRPPLLEDFDK